MTALVLAMGLALPGGTSAAQQQREASEFEIKAAYLYNFLLFVSWPNDELTASNPDGLKTIIIGIVGDDPFGERFAKAGKEMAKAKGKKLVIKRFGRFRAGMDLKRVHLLFISGSEKKRISDILDAVDGAPVLTVADTYRFLEAGGMINLEAVRGKVRFEVNRTPVQLAGLHIRAQLLRLAARTVEIPRRQED